MLEDIQVAPDELLGDMIVTAHRLAGRDTLAGPQSLRLFDPQPHHAIQLATRGAVLRCILAPRHAPLLSQSQKFVE